MTIEEQGTGPDAQRDLRCFWCDAPVGDDSRCLDCGRLQTRICSCGAELPWGADACPECGAQWQGLIKVRRRRKHRRLSGRELLLYAASGIFVALVLGALVNSAIGGLALKNENADPAHLPDRPYERAVLAWETIMVSVQSVTGTIVERMGGAVIFIVIGIIGGLFGVLYYLRREGISLAARTHERPSTDVKRRRRV